MLDKGPKAGAYQRAVYSVEFPQRQQTLRVL